MVSAYEIISRLSGWRSETCQRQRRVEFANTLPGGGNDYQPFAPTLAEREAMAGAIREDVS